MLLHHLVRVALVQDQEVVKALLPQATRGFLSDWAHRANELGIRLVPSSLAQVRAGWFFSGSRSRAR